MRKNDAMRNLSQVGHQSDTTSRFSKKSNIKEILVRNFFRKYPISGEISDIQQLQIERQHADGLYWRNSVPSDVLGQLRNGLVAS